MFDEALKGASVCCHTGEHTYTGWVRKLDGSTPLLYDATRDDGEQFDAVLVDDVISIESAEDIVPIEEVRVTEITASPYDARQYDDAEYYKKVRTVSKRGTIHPIPKARPISTDEFELISGHRRVEAARDAGFETVPVRIVEMDDWEATRQFVFEHVPLPSEREQRPDEFYSDEEIERSVEMLRTRWSDSKLSELPMLEPDVSR